MRPKAIPPAVFYGAVVRDVAVDGVRLCVGGLDLNERDATIHGFRGDVARNLGRPDLFVDAAQVDTPARLLECHGSHDGLERHVARATQDRDLALHRLGRDLVLGAVHLDVGIDPGQVQGHPGRYGVGVVDLRRPAPSRLGLHADDLIGRVDADPVPARVLGHDAHRVAVPRLVRATTRTVAVSSWPRPRATARSRSATWAA